MNDQQDRIKQREALEDAYSNFVEPYVNQLIKVNAQFLPNIDVALPGFCWASGWLALTLFYCAWMRSRAKKQSRTQNKSNVVPLSLKSYPYN